VYGVAFSPDGSVLASGDWGGTIRLWDVEARQPIGEPLIGHTQCVPSLAFAPDGETLVSASWDGTVRVWDMETHQSIGEILVADEGIGFMALSPDGTTVATGYLGANTDIVLWDLGTRQPVGSADSQFTGHTGSLAWLGFTPDGTTLASSSTDTTIRLWDVDSGRTIGRALIGHTDTPIYMAISPDGRTLVSSSWDGTIRLWDLDPESWAERVCQIAGRNLTQDEWDLYLLDEPYEKTCPQWPGDESARPAGE